MSLRVWLPLNGTLENKGLDQVTITNNGATVNNNGKIGKCYSFGTGNSYIIIDSTPLKTFTEFSFACWVKIISWNTSYSTIFAAKNGTLTSWNNLIFSLLRSGSNSNLCFNISNGTSHTATSCYTGILSTNTWYHIVCTYEEGKIKLYQDGNIVNTYNTTVIPNFDSIANLWIGKSNENTYQSNNLLNDVRIYDHALSPLEVKQISQGLILHYPLNRNGWGQENLLKNSYGTIIDKRNNALNSRTEYFAWDVGSSYTDINTSTQVVISFDLEMYVNDITSYSGQLSVYNTNNKGPIQLTNVSYYFKNEYSIGDTIKKRIYLSTTLVPRNDANKTSNYIEFYTGYGSNNFYKISNVKLEKGSLPTPWCPNASDELYNTLGLNDNIQYDTSGYGNNGTKINTLTYSSDTPKYNISTHFGATNQKIHIDNLTTTGFSNSYSFAWWGKRTSNTLMFWGFNNGVRLNGMYLGTLWNTGDSSNNPIYSPNTTTTITAPSVNTWHHYVMTGDGAVCKLYLDGELYGQAKTYKSITGTSIYINGWNNDTSYSHDNMDMSDFRIYATALSAEDVKSLYHNSAYIDNQGNIYGAVLREV